MDVCQLLPEGAEDNPQFQDDLAKEYCTALAKALHSTEPEWSAPAYQLSRGLALDQIIERAQTQTAGIIVLGVKTQSQLGRHLRSSFAYQLLAKATCPVLTIPGRIG